MTNEKQDSSLTTITDPAIEPFYISKDSYCYTIFEKVTPNTSYTEGNKPGKEYSRAWGHYTNFGFCLKELAKLKTNQIKNYSSISDYLKTYKETEENINKLINLGI